MLLHCGDHLLDLTNPQVMGVINVTPESRYAGGQSRLSDQLLQQAATMINDGAAIIDIGGESTRPGAAPVALQEELDRVMPVIEAIQQRFPIIISVDTRKTAVMQAALAAGVAMINDVNALQDEGALELLVQSNAAICLMHMQGTPKTMQHDPHYADVVASVKTFLTQRVEACLQAGIAQQRLVIDPGFGFGKTLVHNAQLLNHLNELQTLNVPVLVGLSRKIMIGAALGLAVEQRLYASLALAVLAINQGATIVRTHDVKPTLDAIRMAARVLAEK